MHRIQQKLTLSALRIAVALMVAVAGVTSRATYGALDAADALNRVRGRIFWRVYQSEGY